MNKKIYMKTEQKELLNVLAEEASTLEECIAIVKKALSCVSSMLRLGKVE